MIGRHFTPGPNLSTPHKNRTGYAPGAARFSWQEPTKTQAHDDQFKADPKDPFKHTWGEATDPN